MTSYHSFLESKARSHQESGFIPGVLPSSLFDFQRDIVIWACRKGKSAIFAGTGLGKTIISLSWADQVVKFTGKPVLILAPLAVAPQTRDEGVKFGIPVNLCRSQADVKPGINITNYEILDKFDCSGFAGIVLDESSILKNFSGKVRTQIIETFRETPYKLACTATPAPNDHTEIGNHAEFLGVMSRTEMLSLFFVHDVMNVQDWRLKRHAVKAFWEWVASWAVMLQNPRDLGYDGTQFDLPPLNIVPEVVTPETTAFFYRKATTLTDRRTARKESIKERVSRIAEIVNNSDDTFLVWCDLNDESAALKAAIPDAVEVRGSDKPSFKEQTSSDFCQGKIRVLISKPSIFGMGLNFQHCHNMVFTGISDSFESYYQSVRRCWRFGQNNQVNVWIVTSVHEGAVVQNIKRKEKQFQEMLSGMIAATSELCKEHITGKEHKTEYKQDEKSGSLHTIVLGDSCEKMKDIPSDSVGLTVTSPPFSSLYTFSDSERDLSNCSNHAEFIEHFRFIVSELFRVTMPGRLACIHCMDLTTGISRDGFLSTVDFGGMLIKLFQECGWYYHTEVTIWKDPVIAVTRTKNIQLLYHQFCKDASISRTALPDRILVFRKPGENPVPITHDQKKFSPEDWGKLASPVWMDINQSKTLQRESARAEDDEKHISALQLDVIERCIFLWSVEGDLVFDPFAGIGSTLYQALTMNRHAYGIELKESYYEQAVENCKRAEKNAKTPQFTLEAFTEAKQAVLS
jgi:DNA modification methylase